MNVDRYIERLRAFEYWTKAFVVVKRPARAAVNHASFEAKFDDAAFQFVGSGFRVRRGQRGKSREPIRMMQDCLLQQLIGGGGKFYR